MACLWCLWCLLQCLSVASLPSPSPPTLVMHVRWFPWRGARARVHTTSTQWFFWLASLQACKLARGEQHVGNCVFWFLRKETAWPSSMTLLSTTRPPVALPHQQIQSCAMRLPLGCPGLARPPLNSGEGTRWLPNMCVAVLSVAHPHEVPTLPKRDIHVPWLGH